MSNLNLDFWRNYAHWLERELYKERADHHALVRSRSQLAKEFSQFKKNCKHASKRHIVECLRKKPYQTRAEAQCNGQVNGDIFRAYKCTYCHCWHLSSSK